MLTSVIIFGQQPASVAGLTLPVGVDSDISTSAIQLKDIDGLDPVEASISTIANSDADGEYFSDSSVSKRNIILKMGLNPNWATQTIQSLRLLLYNFVMPQQPVKLRFTSSEMPDVEIDGWVESMETNQFSKDPEINVSIICPFPHFRAKDETILFGHTIESHGSDVPTVIAYDGSVPTGFEFAIFQTTDNPGYSGDFQIVVSFTTEQVVGPDIVVHQDVLLNHVDLGPSAGFKLVTLAGKKSVRQGFGGEGDSLLGQMAYNEWPVLKPGNNDFSAFAGEVTTIPWVLTYTALYGGL